MVGAGSISARTRSIASWVTRPSCSGATGRPRRSGTARRAPVDGLTVVEERVGRRVEDLVGEHGRLGGVDEVEAHLALPHPPPQLDEAVAVERLGEAVVHRLARERVVGDLDRPADVLLARGGAGEHGGEQVVALHPLEGRRHLLPAAEPQHDQAAVQVPPPAALEDRLVEDGLLRAWLGSRPG